MRHHRSVTLPSTVIRLAHRLFGQPILRNDLRGELVEEIVAMALEPEWQGCGSDWGACDLVRPADGLRIQVKQSAALQSWTLPDGPKPRPCFSIASKTGRYEGSTWIAGVGRNAEIFVFGWHDRCDEGADHREPSQWQFFVVAERDLPDQKSISLSSLRRLARLLPFGELAAEVRGVASDFSSACDFSVARVPI
jgi:hypothetical protein